MGWLADREQLQAVDENGRLVLKWLSSSALRIVESHLTLAQQRGSCPIPNRLMLAAFLSDAENVTARRAEQQGVNTHALAGMLIVATEGRSPTKFELSVESCVRVVFPCFIGREKSKLHASWTRSMRQCCLRRSAT